MGALPSGSEIAEVTLNQFLPTEHAYHNLPELFDRVQNWLNIRSGADELWDVYDCHRNPTGRLQRRGDPIPAGDHHIVVHAFVRCTDGRYLITKRSPNKGFPNMWECTGGSVTAGEDSITGALREVKEELGVDLTAEDLSLIRQEHREHYHDFVDNYVARWNGDIAELTLQETEVVDAKWVTYDELCAMDDAGKIVPTLWYFRQQFTPA
jgi:8-oxo-dGTP pyrophosphatase MutT (NUDIX family)